MSFPTATQSLAALRSIIEGAILNSPRSRQRALGPSEIGNGCDRCLVHMLHFAYCSGDGEKEPDSGDLPWLPFIGTSVHAELQRIVDEHGGDDWATESRVNVGSIDGIDITGSSDVFHIATGTVIDYKIVGKTTLTKVRYDGSGTSLTYQRQTQLYARGLARAGYRVTGVAIWFMPRNGMSLAQSRYFTAPYDERIALEALGRAERFLQWIQAYGVERVLAACPPHTGDEFSCEKFEGPVAAPSVSRLLSA